MFRSVKPLQPFGVLLELDPGTPLAALSRAECLKRVSEHKLVLVRNLVPFDREAFLRFAARDPARELLHWNFGPVMEMKADPQAENYLFSREAVPFHWDGAFQVEPRVLVFHCLATGTPPMAGGETLFSDSEALWNNATPTTRSQWRKIELTYETEKKAHYGGRITRPLVQHHPDKPVTILRYAEPVDSALNPVHLAVKGSTIDRAQLLAEMNQLLYDPRTTYSHAWEENDLLLADNFSLLHGRRAFADASPRHLRRVQIR